MLTQTDATIVWPFEYAVQIGPVSAHRVIAAS